MKNPWNLFRDAPAATRDLFVIAILAVIVLIISAWFDIFESVYGFVQAHDAYQVDEIILLCVFLVLALAVFSVRRLKELGQENATLVRTERELDRVNRQLHLMTSITRHDVLNNLMIVRGYMAILKKKIHDPESLAIVDKTEPAMRAIQAGIEFTREYEKIGLAAARWQPAAKFVPAFPVPPEVRLEVSLPPVEIYADAMLEKVFGNLVDNSLRHGGHVTLIRISGTPGDKGFTIVYEDNGTGVPDNEKTKIFEHGYGKHTGLGLFLAREILLITGITIVENGRPGEGVRFEITVPEDAYRYAS